MTGRRQGGLRARYIFEDGAGKVTRIFDAPLSKDALAKSMKDCAAADEEEVMNIHIINTRDEKDAAPTIGGDVDAEARLAAEVRALERERDALKAAKK